MRTVTGVCKICEQEFKELIELSKEKQIEFMDKHSEDHEVKGKALYETMSEEWSEAEGKYVPKLCKALDWKGDPEQRNYYIREVNKA